jgi:hypothetical protein
MKLNMSVTTGEEAANVIQINTEEPEKENVRREEF